MTLVLEMHVPGLEVTNTTEKLNFAPPKMRIWSHTKAGYSVPREKDGMTRPGAKSLEEAS